MSQPPCIPWEQLSRDETFLAATREKYRLVTVLASISALYYFALPLGASWLRPLFTHYLVGDLNIGLLFAVSQYPVGAVLAYAYVRGLRRINPRIASVCAAHLEPRHD
ncbi:DUF485 domain-containing protein [Phytopseudomonas dryadis]|uniref:DUF485 domain-containing protein n=1 Tax=Phytopseudomonas dryadis TaxID=2487520 RepID=A0A4Q9QVB5_9GAMM|nr:MULTISPECIES: DUF485 domain-containing protein [Pseudomonas]TBU86511.1 hypothetical protein DNK44_22930 [Pseudomonas dryadis]TBV00495.1 hypothetical protein DNK34_23390 [Pseudomonas dryadis]TBV13127.1 hypothetical protein DNK41_23310 [Pseudomonas sp. FRB 230]